MDLRGALDGALFTLQAPLAIGAVLAACLACRMASARGRIAGALLLAASALLVQWLPDTWPATPIASAVVFALGALVAFNVRFGGPWCAVPLVAAGVGAGFAAGVPTATATEAAGSIVVLLVLAGVLLALGAVRVPGRIGHGAMIARRMAGAWIAAVGVILVALWARGIG